jgi:LysM repeat protein
MKQAKRLFYMILLNVIISALTVGVVLQLWERDHPMISAENTPLVLVVTPTSMISLPFIGNDSSGGEIQPDAVSSALPGTVQASPTFGMITYRIKDGDTLGALSIQFNTTVADIMTVNNLTDPDNLSVGQLLEIPTAPLPRVTATAVPPTGIPSPTPRPSATPTQPAVHTATPTLTSQETQVFIDTVIGVGVLETEKVVLRSNGTGELSLAGWRLTDSRGNEYIFPQLTLYQDRTINLNTRRGQDTVSDLFWGLTSPMWRTGELISIYDSQNNLRATYSIH